MSSETIAIILAIAVLPCHCRHDFLLGKKHQWELF